MILRRSPLFLLIAYSLLAAYTVIGGFFGAAYRPFFTPLLSLLAFLFAVLHGGQRLGWGRALLLLALTFGVSLLFESVGVATGLVYGPYHYTERLGPKFLDLVPYLIPVAWYMMMYPALLIARRLVPPVAGVWRWRLGVAALGGLAMTAWDLAMDPMMVAGGHWVWEAPGAYFGVPLQNYWGWWLTTFSTFFLFLWLSRAAPNPAEETEAGFERLALISYTVTGLSSVLVDLQRGLGGPALVGLFAMAPWALLAWLWTGEQRAAGAARPVHSSR